MSDEQIRKGLEFRSLHYSEGIFVMPNAWNAGSACMLDAAGFPAIGTTSAGIAFCLGMPDSEELLTRDIALDEACRIVDAVTTPVSVDAENGYGHEPEDVAETIRRVAKIGAVGANIEDLKGNGLYELNHAAERIKAARASADSQIFSFTLTARTDCYLVGHPNPFDESVIRANTYREAGADCLFVPGIKDADTIAALVKEIDGPISIVMGLAGSPLTVTDLEDLGVKRVSIGGSLARATFGLIRRAAEEIRQNGTFKFANEQIPDNELCQFFSERMEKSYLSGT